MAIGFAVSDLIYASTTPLCIAVGILWLTRVQGIVLSRHLPRGRPTNNMVTTLYILMESPKMVP
jgi:hypothetical protein